MPLQSEMEPDYAPEWEGTPEAKAAVDAGTRSGSMVRRLSPQEAMAAVAPEQTSGARTFQDALVNTDTQTYQAQRRGTGHPNTDRYAATTFGTLDAIHLGRPAYESIDKRMSEIEESTDAGGMIQSEVQAITDEEVQRNLEAVGATTDDTVALMGAYQQLKKWRMDADSTYGFERFTESQLSGIAALQSLQGQNLLRENVYRNYSEATAAREYDTTPGVDKVWDFIKLNVGISTTVAMADFTEKFEAGSYGSVINTLGETVGRITNGSWDGKGLEAYKQVYDDFWKQPAEKRIVLFDQLNAHIKDIAGDNIFAYMSMIMPFSDKASIDELGFDYLMDTVTLAGLVPGKSAYNVVKFMRNVANARKPIEVLKRTGNMKQVADIINKALADRNFARSKKITGMDKDELAWSAQAFDVSHIIPEQMQGVSADAARSLEKDILDRIGAVDRAWVNTADPSQTPARHYFTDAAMNARKQEVLGQFDDYQDYARISETTETGFRVEVQRGSQFTGRYTVEDRWIDTAVQKQNIIDYKDEINQLERQMDNPYYKALPYQEQLYDGGAVQALKDKIHQAEKNIVRNNLIIKDLNKQRPIESHKINYVFDKDSGRFKVEEGPGYFASKTLSPSQTFDKLAPGSVDEATLAEFTETQIIGNLNRATRESRRGLTGKQLEDIDKLLIEGDKLGRVFDVADLINGVDTTWGRVQLDSTASIGAYLAERRNWDKLHAIKDYTVRRNLESKNFKQLRLNIKNSQGDPIKVFAKDHSERATIPAGVKRIYDHKSGSIVDVNKVDDIGARLNGGEWGIVQFRQGQRFGDEVINYGLVKRDKDLKPISGPVLNYRNGYVARQRPGVFYVVRRRVPRMVDGVKQDSIETARFFNREDEALTWKAEQADAKDLMVVPDTRLRSSENQDFDDEFDMLNFGGLYTGERSDRTILMGLDGKEANRMSAYKSLSLYQAHVANRYATNELKMSLIQRFQNTYGEHLQNPGNWKSPLRQEAANDLSLRNAVENARDYINNMLRVPDPFQDWWAARMRSLGEAMEGKPLVGGKIRDWTMDFSTRDPTAFLRAATFHQYLGMFNPSQVLVQGLGMATAMAAYPGKALKILPQNLAISAAWLGRHNLEAVEKIANSAGVNGAWLRDVIEEINRVGLFDSLKTSADYNAGVNGISMSADALRRVMDAGLLPMRAGEMWARGYGYLLARDMFMKGKKATYKPTPKEVDQIAKDANRFTLNLNRSNRAFWQKGLLSIPTQFWQVTMKFMENMVGGSLGMGVRKWTPAEKAKIMVGYLGMFGMAGVPFMDSAISGMVNTYRNATNDPKAMTIDRLNIFNNLPEDMQVDDATFARLMRGGLLQVMAHWMTGADPEIVSRVSIPAGIEETIDLYNSGDRDMTTAIGGAMAPGLGRYFDAAKGLWDILAPNRSDLTITDEERRQAWSEIAKILSSTRNAEKSAWWRETGRSVTNAKGQRLFPDMETDEWNSTLGWQALGFSPAKVGWMYDLQSSTTELEGRVNTRVEAAWDVIKRHAPDKDAVDSQHKRDSLNIRIDLLTKDLTPTERQKFYNGIKKKILDDKSKVTAIVEEAVRSEAAAGGLSTQGSIANPLLVE